MMAAVGYFVTWLFGAWVSFVVTFWIAIARIRGGLETFAPAIGLGLMAASIWTIAYIWAVHP